MKITKKEVKKRINLMMYPTILAEIDKLILYEQIRTKKKYNRSSYLELLVKREVKRQEREEKNKEINRMLNEIAEEEIEE